MEFACGQARAGDWPASLADMELLLKMVLNRRVGEQSLGLNGVNKPASGDLPAVNGPPHFLLAEWNPKGQQCRLGRTMLAADPAGAFAHLVPDQQRCGIHIKQPHLLAAFSSLAVNADRGQKLRLL